MWQVRFLEHADLVVGELDVQRRNGVGHVMQLGRPDNGGGDNWVLQHPCECQLGHRDTASFRDLLYRIDDWPVTLDVVASTDLINVKALRVLTPGPGKPSLGERAPGNAANSLIGKEAEHFALFLTLHQVVLVLHADELRPAMKLGRLLHLGELPSPHRRRADVACFAGLDHVVQRFHCLVNWSVRIEAVNLVQVDVVGVEAGQ